MNPRQRRAVLLLAIAALGLVGVFALVANYVSEVETQVGDKIVVLELTRPVAANEAMPDNAVRRARGPEPVGAGGRAVGLHPARSASSPAPICSRTRSCRRACSSRRRSSRRASARKRSWSTPRPASPARRARRHRRRDRVLRRRAGRRGQPAQAKPNRSMVIVPGAEVINVGTPRLKGANGVQDAPSRIPARWSR